MIDINSVSKFSDNSKVWVYYPKSEVQESLHSKIKTLLSDFSESWKSHGTKVENYINFIKPYSIIVIIADSNTFPSGCSIDSQVSLIRQIEDLSNVEYMNRQHIYYLKDNQYKISSIQSLNQELDANTMVFNPFFDDLKDWSENFLVLAKNSKYKRLLGY